MINLPIALVSAALVAGTSLTFGVDALDASIDSMIESRVLQQHSVCAARTAALLMPAEWRPQAEATCRLHAQKQIEDDFAPVKNMISALRIS